MRRSLWVMAALTGALALGATACGGSSADLGRQAAAQAGVPPRTAFAVYFLQGERLTPVRRTVPKTQAVAAAAVRSLLAGPAAAERSRGYLTAVPPETRLRSISLSRGIATVDLTSRFAAGGGSLAVRERLGQLACTLTQFPSVQGVRLRLDGKAVDVFSGEGLVLDHPLARSAFEDLLPAVLVESPLPGDRVASPLSVRGSADVFEAVFRLRLQGPDGATLVQRTVHASAGTGTRGSFASSLNWTGKGLRAAVLLAEVQSAKDGTWHVVAKVPVKLGG